MISGFVLSYKEIPMPISLPSQDKFQEFVDTQNVYQLQYLSNALAREIKRLDGKASYPIDSSTISYIVYSRTYLKNLEQDKSKELAKLEVAEQGFKSVYAEKYSSITSSKAQMIDTGIQIDNIVKLINVLSNLDKEISESEASKLEAEGLENATKVSLEVINGAIAKATKSQHESGAEFKKYTDDSRAFKAQLDKFETLVSKTEARVNILQQAITDLSKKVVPSDVNNKAAHDAQLKLLRAELTTKHKELEVQKSSVVRIKSLMVENDKKLNLAKNDLDAAKEEKKSLSEQKDRLSNDESGYKQQIKGLSRVISQKRQEQTAKSSLLDKLKQSVLINLENINRGQVSRKDAEVKYAEVNRAVYNLAYSLAPYTHEVVANAAATAVGYAASFLPSMPALFSLGVTVANEHIESKPASPTTGVSAQNNDSLTSPLPPLIPATPLSDGVLHARAAQEQALLNPEITVTHSDGLNSGTERSIRGPFF